MSFRWIGKVVKWVLQHPEVIELGESIVRGALKKKDAEDDAAIEALIEEQRREAKTAVWTATQQKMATATEALAADVAKRTGRQPKKRRAA
jgi:hypothetical protein